jgi:hypothetical protein
LPSHLFQTWLYSHAGFNLWNNYWYAGRYEFVTYSVLYYPVASAIGQALATMVAAAVLAGSFASVSRREWGSAATGPSLSFAATALGQDGCQTYKLVYQTVYDQRQVNAYRIETETVFDEQRQVRE